MKTKTAQQQLDAFLDKYTNETAALARVQLKKLRKRLRGAVQMVYDNYNALVVGFGPTDRPSEALFSLVMFPKKVCLCFLQGAKLSDPKQLLRGEGKQVRSIILADADTLDDPDVEDLISRALSAAPKKIDDGAKGEFIIKSISPKQRPRRPRKRKQSHLRK